MKQFPINCNLLACTDPLHRGAEAFCAEDRILSVSKCIFELTFDGNVSDLVNTAVISMAATLTSMDA